MGVVASPPREEEILQMQAALEAGEDPWQLAHPKRGLGRPKVEKPAVIPPGALENYAKKVSGDSLAFRGTKSS
eukprot:3226180-Amphidinium_carterae.1